MTLSDFDRKMSQLLKDFIESEDHIDTGALYRSIKFNSDFRNNNLDIKFNSEEYIVYLQDGDFLDKFFDLKRVQDLIAEFYINNLEIDI